MQMDTRLLKYAAQSSVLLMIAVIILSVAVTDYPINTDYVLAMDDKTVNGVKDSAGNGADGFVTVGSGTGNGAPGTDASENGNIRNKLGKRYLVLPKNKKQKGQAVLTEQYVYRTIELMVDQVEEFSWDESSVLRVQDELTYEGAPEPGRLEVYMDEYLYLDEEPTASEDGTISESGEEAEEEETEDVNEDMVQAVRTEYDADSGKALISITLNHLYVPFLYEDEENYYIDLRRPRDVYEKILVIDAGHGGKHPGTMSQDHVYLEKDFNLDIISCLKELLDMHPEIKVYYTRLTDTSVYLRPRVDLANEAEADFFISVHNNAYRDQYAYGTEVLYNELLPDVVGKNVNSKKLASLCLEEVTALLGTRNRGLSQGSETYIIGHSKVPVALVEVGYLTNREDLSMLLKEENIALTAQGIYNAIMKAYKAEAK